MKRRLCLLAGLGTVMGGVHAAGTAADRRGGTAEALRIAVAPGPQAEVMDVVVRQAATEGLALATVLRTDSPSSVNRALAAGVFDAASVQDAVSFQADPSRARLAEAALTLTQPMALYSRRVASLRELPVGARVALPVEPALTSRALVLLHNHGLLELKAGAGLTARQHDILRIRRGLQLVMLPAAALGDALRGPAALAVIDRPHAVAAGLLPARDSIGIEDGRTPWAGLLSVRRQDLAAPWLPRLVAACHSAPVRRFILEQYQDSVRRPW